MEFDVVAVGSCNIDQIAHAPRLPHPGETIHGDKYEVGFGGKGANQCVAAAKLGARTAMIAKVGDDDNGRNYIANMESLEVNVSHVLKSSDACTGVAPIIVGADGNNMLVVVSGANLLLTAEDVEAAEDVLNSAKVLLCQLEIKMETTLYALKHAKKAGVFTIFNPSPAVSELSREFYENSDIICANETEASLLSGINVVDINSAIFASQEIVTKGSKTCVITMGKDGCVFAQGSNDPCHVPGIAVDTVDTTGAGDAFLGALAYFICYFKHLDMKELLHRACVVAAKSVQCNGTQTSFPIRDNLPETLFR